VLIAWLQVLRLAVQILSLLLVLLMPGLVGLLVIAASVWGLVILVGFVDRAHGFGNWGKAAAMLLLSALAMVMVLSLILMMAGVGPVEGT
jgi:hypothetical protein